MIKLDTNDLEMDLWYISWSQSKISPKSDKTLTSFISRYESDIKKMEIFLDLAHWDLSIDI